MRWMRVLPLLLLGLGLGVSTAVADAATVPKPQARMFRVAVVDTGFKASWREELNQQLRERFQRAVERAVGAGIVVKTEVVDARTAATRLSKGGCDAVMILGDERPRGFWRSEIPAIAASMSSDRNFEPVYLIVASADAALRHVLGEALVVAVVTPAPARGPGQASD